MQQYQRHILFWASIYFLWTFMKSGRIAFQTYLIINLLNLAIYMSAYYGLKHIQLPYFYNRGKIVLFILSLLGVSIFFYTIWRTAGILWIDEWRGLKGRIRFMSFIDYMTQTVQFYSPAMALLAWESHHERKAEQERIHQLEKEKLTTELKFLKAQLNPHFLFNTLNNLYSFVVNGSPKAPDMILGLSGILDYVLYRSQQTSVPLSEEITAIENFINLEKIRYGERLQVDYQTAGNKSVQVSPLLLLSLVENAFKHGASGDIDQPKITVDIQEKNEAIICKVWNTKSSHQGELNDAYKEGIGLSNIKRQLNLVYPDKHELIIKNEANTFTILLTIQPNSHV